MSKPYLNKIIIYVYICLSYCFEYNVEIKYNTQIVDIEKESTTGVCSALANIPDLMHIKYYWIIKHIHFL